MPHRRKAYSFKVNNSQRKQNEPNAAPSQPEVEQSQPVDTPRPIAREAGSSLRSRTRSFIAKRSASSEQGQLEKRGSVRLRSFRKRKMADREETENNSQAKTRKLSSMDQGEIQRKIEDQIRMRDGVMKLMSACSNFKQTIDASKNYLTINARVLALMSALQKKKSELVLKEYKKSNSREDVEDLKPCAGNIMISDIRIPLMWKDGAHFRGKTGEQLYFMFCLLKLGNHVYDTSLKQVDVTDTDVNFNEIVKFEDVQPDFKLNFEIYYTVTSNPDYHLVTPIRTPRKGATTFSAPNYCLAGHTQFTVNDVKGGILTFDVAMGGKGASATTALGQADELPDNELDLWGQICCCLSAQPLCMISDGLSGTVNIQNPSSAQQPWTEYFCTLRHCSLDCWKAASDYEKDEDKPCDYSIKIKPTMSLSQTKLPGLNQDNVLIITSSGVENEPVLAFPSKDDMLKWKRALKQEIANAEAWKVACEKFMEPKRAAKSLIIDTSTRLYDQIKVDDLCVETPKVPQSPAASSPSTKKNGTPKGSPRISTSSSADDTASTNHEVAANGTAEETNGTDSVHETAGTATAQETAGTDTAQETADTDTAQETAGTDTAQETAGTVPATVPKLETDVDGIEPTKEVVKVQTVV